MGLASNATAIRVEDCVCPNIGHHEHIYPHSDGEGTAGIMLAIVTDSEDEDTGAQSNQNYWGEPVTFDPSKSAEWNILGMYASADTAAKIFQWQMMTCDPSLSSAKNGGNAWDKTATVLTVVDGSLFVATDKVAIFSDYKVEIAVVSSVAGNAVTIARETHAVGIAGLRWDHTTNDPGTEVMYRVSNCASSDYHPMGGTFSASSTRDHTRLSLHAARLIAANGFVLIRALNQTDGTNAASFSAAIIYND